MLSLPFKGCYISIPEKEVPNKDHQHLHLQALQKPRGPMEKCLKPPLTKALCCCALCVYFYFSHAVK